MNFRFFFTIMTLTAIHQSFSMTFNKRHNLNNQLAVAAQQGNNTKVASLVQAGVDINAKDSDGFTPLHWAAFNGHRATVELLLSDGANINARGFKDGTPLHFAAMNGQTATVELLLSKSADINAKGNYGITPLEIATDIGRIATVELLKAYQTLVPQDKKPTPKQLLRVAIEHGYSSLVKWLLQRVTPDASDLQFAKKQWQNAQDKESYEAIGCLLVIYLSLVPGKAPSIVGCIAKAGIGLPESIAQEIATFVQ